MADPADYELIKSREEDAPPGRAGRRVWPWIAGALLVAAIAIAAYLVYGRRPPTGEAGIPARAAAPAEPGPNTPTLGGTAAAIDLPPLDQTDAVVRTLVQQLSAHPQVAAWLATDGLIRNFVVVVVNIAEGRAPSAQLRALRPAARPS